jgi:hypothetical protein
MRIAIAGMLSSLVFACAASTAPSRQATNQPSYMGATAQQAANEEAARENFRRRERAAHRSATDSSYSYAHDSPARPVRSVLGSPHGSLLYEVSSTRRQHPQRERA